MTNFWLRAFKPTRNGALLLLATALSIRQGYISRLSYKIIFFAWLLFINRGALPLRWHLQLLGIALRARLRFDLAQWGLRKPTLRQKGMALQKGELALGGIGCDPFEIVTVRSQKVGFAEADYNMHMSNSVYAQQGDFARMAFASDFVGAPFSQDKIITLLGSTSFVYLREIPIFTTYTTETRIVAWDSKWCYFLARFVIPYNPSSRRPPSKSFSTGQDVTVCAYLLSRLCFKRGRTNVSPERVFALAGWIGRQDPDFAQDSTAGRNWHAAKAMRRNRSVVEWLRTEDNSDNGTWILGADDRNRKALELIDKLHGNDRSVWVELDELRY